MRPNGGPKKSLQVGCDALADEFLPIVSFFHVGSARFLTVRAKARVGVDRRFARKTSLAYRLSLKRIENPKRPEDESDQEGKACF